MIRKPTDDDFREGDAVTAVRETRKITVEGAQGIAKGAHTLLLIWLGGTMIFGLVMSLAAATAGIALIPLAIFGFMFWRSRKKGKASRDTELRAEPQRPVAAAPAMSLAAPARLADDDFAFPADVRRQGCVEADIGAVVQQAFVLFFIGAMLMVVFGASMGGAGIITGMAFVIFAVLVGSRIFGDRKLIEWDTRKVKVWNLLSDGEMQWSDVTDVTVEKAGRADLDVYLQSGSRRNIVLTAAVNRLGGPTTLRVPIRYTNLSQPELEALLRDLFCWRAAGNSIAPGVSADLPHNSMAPAPAITPLSDPRQSFDPDAIMARHLREREQILADVDRQSAAPPRPSIDQRPVFGRKRA